MSIKKLFVPRSVRNYSTQLPLIDQLIERTRPLPNTPDLISNDYNPLLGVIGLALLAVLLIFCYLLSSLLLQID